MRLREFLPKGRRKEFADLIGVSLVTINRICSGGFPSASVAQEIVRMSNGLVTFEDLYQVDPPKPKGDIEAIYEEAISAAQAEMKT